MTPNLSVVRSNDRLHSYAKFTIAAVLTSKPRCQRAGSCYVHTPLLTGGEGRAPTNALVLTADSSQRKSPLADGLAWILLARVESR